MKINKLSFAVTGSFRDKLGISTYRVINMRCAIYKGEKKANTFLFIEKKDDFSRLPNDLLKLLGSLQFIMDLELTADRLLAQANTGEVLDQLKNQGFYLQMPPSQGHILDQQS